MLKTCAFCGKQYEAKRRTSKYCSPACRVSASRESKCVISAPAAIEQTRELMHLLDVLSLNGPDTYREICGHLSSRIADALSEIGQ